MQMTFFLCEGDRTNVHMHSQPSSGVPTLLLSVTHIHSLHQCKCQLNSHTSPRWQWNTLLSDSVFKGSCLDLCDEVKSTISFTKD